MMERVLGLYRQLKNISGACILRKERQSLPLILVPALIKTTKNYGIKNERVLGFVQFLTSLMNRAGSLLNDFLSSYFNNYERIIPKNSYFN
jgi:hypothetical protein